MKFIFLVVLASLSTSAKAADRADHDCRIFLNYAGRIAGSERFLLTAQIAKSSEMRAPKTVKFLVRANQNRWQEVATRFVKDDGRFEHYEVKYLAEDVSLTSFDLIPFVAFQNGTRLFDHNSDHSDQDFVRLSGKNQWIVYGQPDRCMAY